ncbi:MAG TPA: carboxypeptidase-like regulatory domain-containing protein, partial [Planctomycetota bacterium]|nr:carboxypeptidase-like regulatory domain-containing protein [Planctomycetota bacterium]
ECRVSLVSVGRSGYLAMWLPRRGATDPLAPCVVPEGSPPSESNALEVRLEKGVAVLHGVVRTRDGKPVPRAWIQLSSEKSRRDGFWLNSIADAEGRYRMPPAPAGPAVLDAGAYMLHIERRGETPFVAPDADRTVVLPESGEMERDIVLVPDSAIEGRMVLADGSPAAGYIPILIRADRSSSNMAAGPPSAEDGTFRVEELWPGKGLTIAAEGPKGRVGVSAAFDLEESATVTGVVVRVVLPASLEVSVARPDGTPIGDAWIRLDRREREARPRHSGGGADPDGAFRCEDIEAGEWVAVATAPGFLASAAERLVLAEGEARRGVVLRLREGRAISGRVLDGHGQPVAGAGVGAFAVPEPILFTGSILIKPGGPADAEQSTETGPDGAFRITGLDEVPYEIAAWKEGLVGSVASLGSGDGAVDLRVRRPSSIAGVVLDPDGAPLEGASVEVRDPGAPGESMFDGFRFGWLRGGSEDPFDRGNSRSGPDGRFDVDAPEGECRVVAAMEGLALGEAVVRSPAEDVQLRLREPLSIAGRVVRPDGSPAAGAWVQARSVERGEVEGADTSGEDGSFRVEGLAPGRYALSARNPVANLVPAEPDAVAEAGATEFVIPTREGFRFRASVRLPGGGVPARDEFAIVVEKAAGGRTTLDYGEIDESGVLVVAGLGRCTLRIHLLRDGEFFERRDPLPGTVFGPFEVPGPDRTITLER